MQTETPEYELLIDFAKGRGDPARVFQAMGAVLDAFKDLDRHLVGMIDLGIDASVVLDDVSAGSIRVALRTVIAGIPDEVLAKADWKLVLGHFLLKAKYLILKWCDARDAVVSREDVEMLEEQLASEAAKTQLKMLPAYAPVQLDGLLRDVQAIQQSLSVLDEGETVSYVSYLGRVRLNPRLIMPVELVRDLLTRNVVKTNQITLVRVKKPDYLGRSQWSFQYSGHKIEASILDKEWLGRFQGRLIDVRPGDSLKVDLAHEIFYGYLGEVVHQQYAVDHVIDVVRPEAWDQVDAFEDDE